VRLYAFFDGLIEGVAVDLPGEAVKGDNEFAFVEVGFRFFVEIDVGGFEEGGDGWAKAFVFLEPDARPEDGGGVGEKGFKPFGFEGVGEDAFGGVGASEVDFEGFLEAAVLVEFEDEVVVAVVFVEGLTVPSVLELLEELGVGNDEGAEASLEGVWGVVGDANADEGPFTLGEI
jgi:hypothetical protein